MEDLWSFNEEIVARAIAASTIAIISGVGHETDFTIADFVADVRASTPSAAAELVVQTRREFDKHINEMRDNLASLIRYRLSASSRRVHELSARRAFRRPLDLLRQHRQRSDEMTSRLALGLAGTTENYAAPSRIGGWNVNPVSQGKKIQVSCDTSVMNVSTSGLPRGLA